MRHCFFDLDGTLADTDPDIRGSWKAALRDLGLECPDFDEKFVAGPPFDEMARILFPERFTQKLADSIRRLFASHYDHDGFPLTREYPGVLDAVRAIRERGNRVYVITNKRYAGAMAMARHFGWDRVFDGIYAGDMHRDDPKIGVLRKPALLRMVMEARGIAAADAVLVGDTALDFEAAAANGVKSVGVEWGYGKADELKAADVRVASVADMLSVIQNI